MRVFSGLRNWEEDSERINGFEKMTSENVSEDGVDLVEHSNEQKLA